MTSKRSIQFSECGWVILSTLSITHFITTQIKLTSYHSFLCTNYHPTAYTAYCLVRPNSTLKLFAFKWNYTYVHALNFWIFKRAWAWLTLFKVRIAKAVVVRGLFRYRYHMLVPRWIPFLRWGWRNLFLCKYSRRRPAQVPWQMTLQKQHRQEYFVWFGSRWCSDSCHSSDATNTSSDLQEVPVT